MNTKTTSNAGKGLSSVSSDSKLLNGVTRFVVILVAVGAAVLSFGALTDLAIAAGISFRIAWIWAVVIDGFILVATLAAFALKDRDGKGKIYAWVTLATFVILSIIGNAWHAAIMTDGYILPLEAAIAVTAIPPLALFLAIHLLVIMVSPTKAQKEEKLRLKRKAERLKIYEEKELEKLEKQAITQEIKEASFNNPSYVERNSNQLNDTKIDRTDSRVKHSSTVERKLTAYPPQVSQPVSSPSLTSSEGRTFPKSAFMSDEEVFTKLDSIFATEGMLPTGKNIAEWLGKSERTGQNLLKRFKETRELN